MVSCQEPPPLEGEQTLFAVSPPWCSAGKWTFLMAMGVKARCRPSKSAAHCRRMKRQPFLHGRPRRGRLLCHCRCHLRLQPRRHCCCRHCHHCNRPSPSPLLWAIAAVAVNHPCCHLCRVAVSHHCRRHPCRPTLPSPSLLAITVAIAVGHHGHRCRWPFPRVVALARQELYSTNWSKECLPYFILLGQWAVYWSKLDHLPGVKQQWPTPALSSK